MDQPRPEMVPDPAVKRMSLYLRQLESFRKRGQLTVSSKQLGESLGLTDAQVRKDLAYFEERLDGSTHIRFKDKYLPFTKIKTIPVRQSNLAEADSRADIGGQPPNPRSLPHTPLPADAQKDRAESSARPAVQRTTQRSGRTPAEPYPSGGQFGHPGIGYRTDDLIAKVKHILGTDKVSNVVIVGAGNLGKALSTYRGFNAKGFNLVAVFDNDPTKVGKRVGNFMIQPLSELEATVQKHAVRLAVMAVPADNAQEVADRLVAMGIRGLLNFAPVSLSVPEKVALNAVDLAVQLEQLSFQVNLTPGDAG